ncbi:MAG TPA: Ig-like domain-containing protein [Anaerolineales bacterium]|nr:Ig-like domain-containing protein [Anaerolineales bacterium]
MTKRRLFRALNGFLLASLFLASCAGAPTLPFMSPTATPLAPTAVQQAFPPALIETDPPINSVIGHQSPLTFYFNQPMNKPSVESAFSGLPSGTFTWTDEATLVFTPSEPYPPNSTLTITLANTAQSATGFGFAEPLQLSFNVADYLRAVNLLPKADATDVNVDAAIAVSFNQPVVPLGADSSSLPPAFSLTPAASGRGEWINTSTYVFYPEPPLSGGTEYTVSLNQDLKTVSGVGLEGSGQNSWRFVTSRPRVILLEPASDQMIPIDAKIRLTFNQPMDAQSVQANFLLSGTEGPLNGTFEWNEDGTILTFTPERQLARNVGYILNLGAAAMSRNGITLVEEFGAVLRTYDNFAVLKAEPGYGTVTFTFSAPLAEEGYDEAVKVSPALDEMHVNISEDGLNLFVNGTFAPDTKYVIELADTLKDRWGQSLGKIFALEFQTPPVTPSLTVQTADSYTTFVRPDEPVLYANAVNIQNVEVTVAPVSLQEYFTLQSSFDAAQAFTPTHAFNYAQNFDLPPSEPQQVTLNLTEANNQLLPGLYYVAVTSPQNVVAAKSVYFAISSQVNLTFKAGASDALVWAVDLPSQAPLSGAPVTIYDETGNVLGSGITDANGLWKGAIGEWRNRAYAVLGQPGDENFALAISNMNMGISAWQFGYTQFVQAPHTEIYMYTDRPIYRPGQTVYYRGIVRRAFNGRYELPEINTLPLSLTDANGTQLASLEVSLSPYGTFNGQYELPAEAVPGYYTFQNPTLDFYLSFQVAEYRKPEINLSVEFSSREIQVGDTARATVKARYFFDAPASNVEIKWALYRKPDPFYLPNYQTGILDTSWLDPYPLMGLASDLGTPIAEGTGQTTPQGILSIELPPIPESDAAQIITLEVTAQDESGLPVSARTEMRVHPADFYIGLRPDQWIGKAKSPLEFEVFTSDWAGNPSGDKPLAAEFKQVRWEQEENEFGFPIYTPVYTSISSSNFVTGPDGRARLSFIPPHAGTFMLDVSGNGAHSQILVWVGGESTAAWPDLPNQRLELTPDRVEYRAGDTAKIFIPNPFITNSRALVTIERGVIFSAEVITLSGSGMEYAIPITEEHAPNIYVSVTVLGQGNDFRHGYLNIPVTPLAQTLNVQVIPSPPQAGPRDSVTFDVLVTDHTGQPVEGEFSLSVVDQAALALADPNAEDILSAFYSTQPLGIETGLSLAAYSGRRVNTPGGLGGGGGGEVPTFVREEFPDTAYWNPSLITNSEGRGQITMTLPDSLTTWQVDVRGLTLDTKVGQAETQIVATKPLLIRPVTPRFLVSGDHVLMAAIVNNNTSNPLNVAVTLQAEGFLLDDPDTATKNLTVPANGRMRVEWWGTAGLAESADLTFSVISRDEPSLQDAARPVWGPLPILQYLSPQAFVTSGSLRGATTQQEVISLPRTFAPTSGSLDLELSPSLAGSLLSALEAMDDPDTNSAEAILSHTLPHLEIHRALKNEGLDDPELTARVISNLNARVSRLLYLQNSDGGWQWWGTGGKSDPYISAYIVLGLHRARLAGAPINDDALSRAITYLQTTQSPITINTQGAELDNATFVQFVLSQLGAADQTTVNALFDARDRMSPSSIALLAYTLRQLNPADARVGDLISGLQARAIRTSSSAHWETPRENLFTRGSPIYTSSLVLYVLAQLDPANPLTSDAVRYLAAHRNTYGLWNLGHENTWAILALNEAMIGIGELRADFAFHAALNGSPLTSGDVAGIQLTPLDAHVPLEFLSPTSPNLLTISREDGLGKLYYRAVLHLNRPVEEVKPINAGMSIERAYCAMDSARTCTPLSTLSLSTDKQITARLTLTLPNDAYYVMIEDFIPAGTEILNRALKTSQQGIEAASAQPQFDENHPFANGWGWWLFNEPQIRDDSILFTADYLPAGTYILTYTLIPLQAGEYRVLPAHAWQAFFPEVQGTSAGTVVEIKP